MFLTFNDYPGGIFSGQVVDVCRFLQSQGNEVRLLSLVSLRNYFSVRKTIRAQYANCTVLPMWPGVANWRKNATRIGRAVRKFNAGTVIARGAFAANLALQAKRNNPDLRVVFDGRGAYKAEFGEFNVAGSAQLNAEIASVEKRAVLESGFRIAVSEALVAWWRNEYGYSTAQHAVIPCTLRAVPETKVDRNAIRGKLGFAPDDIVIVYSGSNAGWQSFDELDRLLPALFERNEKVKLLMLTGDISSLQLAKKYPACVVQQWVAAHEVFGLLSACDYGWLVRNGSVTNQVASPVKFAEYLACGLDVLISPGLGDFSVFVHDNGCGLIATTAMPDLASVAEEKRTANKALAQQHFVKAAYAAHYKQVAG